MKSIGLLILLQQGLEQVLEYCLDLLFSAVAQFWGNMGEMLGFLYEAGVRSIPGQNTLSLIPAVFSFQCSMTVEISLYILVT